MIQIDIDNLGGGIIDIQYFNAAEVGANCAAAAPAGATVAGTPLTIAKAGSDITLSWGPSCAAGDDDFAIYEGPLGDFAANTSKVCSTDGAQTETLAPDPADSYYLVVPRNANFEGSYGTQSGNAERPPSAAACLAQEIAACE